MISRTRRQRQLGGRRRQGGLGQRCPAETGWRGGGGSVGATFTCDGHQFHRPSKATVAGTSTVRTTKVSSRMPTARPTPMSVI